MNRHPYMTDRDNPITAPISGPYRSKSPIVTAERAMLAGLVLTLAALAAGWLG